MSEGSDVLSVLQNSRVPIKRLGVYLTPRALSRMFDIAPNIRHLESLLLVAAHELDTAIDPTCIGSALLAHLPRLHTFLLSDGPFKREDPTIAFRWAWDYSLQRQLLVEYHGYAPGLRRMAFTTEFEWEKRADGRWYPWNHIILELYMLFDWCDRVEC
ncbi:hypothetical protein BD413DRAFT_608677 [Trametes elegans]|nr:hypothetical protein BD413DRAFT_608677 [Trametes elegans]